MTRQGYSRQQKILQNRIMKAYITPVNNALRSQVEPYVTQVKKSGVRQAYVHAKTMPGMNHEIGPVIKSLYRDAAKLAEPKTRIRKAGGFGINFDFIADVLAYFAEYIFMKVVLPITQTTQDQIRDLLEQALVEGWGIDETVSKLEDPELTAWRARTIVRTESVRAMNYSQMTAANKTPFEMQKEWIAIEDSRTRGPLNRSKFDHTHSGLDGKVIDIDKSFFSNGEYIGFPGDPSASAANTINCRCTLGYSYKKDANGKFIPKKNIPSIPIIQ